MVPHLFNSFRVLSEMRRGAPQYEFNAPCLSGVQSWSSSTHVTTTTAEA